MLPLISVLNLDASFRGTEDDLNSTLERESL